MEFKSPRSLRARFDSIFGAEGCLALSLLGCLLIFLPLVSPANAQVTNFTVTPLNAGGIVPPAAGSTGNTTVYYPQVAPAGNIFLDSGLHRFDQTATGTTVTDDLLKFRLTASLAAPSPNLAWVLMIRPSLSSSSMTTVVSRIITLSGGTGTFFPSSAQVQGIQLLPAREGSQNFSIDIGIYPQATCALTNTVIGCSSNAVDTSVSMPLTFVLSPIDVITSTPTEAVLQSATASASVTLNVQYATSTLSDVTVGSHCPSMDDIYKPSNSKIDVLGSRFAAIATSPGTAPLSSLIVAAQSGTSDATVTSSYPSANTLYGTIAWGADASIAGFQNTSSAAVSDPSTQYQIRFMVRDAAGYVSPFNAGSGGCVPGATAATQRSSCCLVGVRTANVDQFLKTGKCFIATAVFRNENAAPVRFLRKFRDRILVQSNLGLSFVRFYYTHSPRAADWLNHHGYLRPVVGVLLIPVFLIALVFLYPVTTLILLGFASLLISFLKSKRRAVQLASLVFVLTVAAAISSTITARADEVSNLEPYIEQLKRTAPKRDEPTYEATEGDNQPYIEHLKKTEPQPEGVSSDNYSERLRRTDPNRMKEDRSVNYTERERAHLPSDPDANKSAIQSVFDGKSELKQRKMGKVNEAAGVRIGAAMTHSIKNSKRSSNADIEDFYGAGYHPDVTFFYEFQPLRTNYFGTLGLGVSAGLVYFTKRARYDVTLTNPVTQAPFSADSQVRLKFYTVPITPYASYRLHLLKYLVPYVQAGPSAIFYAERRTDEDKMRKGYSTGYSAGGGVMLLLDWIFPGTTWELYSSSGIHHLYLTADYFRTEALTGDVKFSMYGATGGLTYEF